MLLICEVCLEVGWDARGENEFRFGCGCSEGDSWGGGENVDDTLGDCWGELPFDIEGGRGWGLSSGILPDLGI